MRQLIADDNLRQKLETLDEQAEVRSPEGRLIGFFTPVTPAEEELYRRAAAEIDPQEVLRRKESGADGLSTEEVLDHLTRLDAI